jgi:hypothetical protein
MRLFLPTLLAAFAVASTALAQATPSPRPDWATADAIERNLVAAMENPTARNAFLTSFLNGEVFVRVDQATLDAVVEQQSTGQGTVTPRYFTGIPPGGEEVIFAFSRRELARLAFGEEVPLLGMSGETALRTQSRVGIVLNYNNGPSVTFSPQDIATLLASIQRREVTPPPASSPH